MEPSASAPAGAAPTPPAQRGRADSLILLAGNVLPLLTGVATAPLTARALGPGPRGVVTVSIAVSSVLVVADSVGLPWRARYDMVDEPRRAWALNRIGRRVSAASLVPTALIGLALSAHYGLHGWQRALSVGFFCSQALAAWLAVRAAVVLTTRRLAVLGATNLIAAASVVAAIFALLATHHVTVGSALAANALGVLVQLVISGFLSRSVVTAGRGHTAPGRSRWVSSWAGQIADSAASRADLLIAGLAYSTAAVGRYSIASILGFVCYQVSQTLLQRDLPELSASADRRAAFWWSMRRLLLANVVVAGVGALAAAVVVPPLFGREFRGAVAYLPGVAVLALGLAVLAAVLFDLSRHNSPVWTPMAYGLVPAVVCAAIVTTLPVPSVLMPVTLGVLYLATGAVAGYCLGLGRTGPDVRHGRARPHPNADSGAA